MKILFWSICALVGSVGTVAGMAFFAQQGQSQKVIIAEKKQPETQSQQITQQPNTTSTPNQNSSVIVAQPSPITTPTQTPQHNSNSTQQYPTPQTTFNPDPSYRQYTKSVPGTPLRIRAWADYDLTSKSNVGAVRPGDYVLVNGRKVSINRYGCDGTQPLEFSFVVVPPEIEVLDPATDEDQPNDVEPQREGYAANCGLNL